jgi:hypothetical protein
MTDDWNAKSPQKLKNIDIKALEKKFSILVEDLIDAEDGDITANISSIDFRPHGSSGILTGATEIKICFSQHIPMDIFDKKDE